MHQHKTSLKRSLSLSLLTYYGLGNILGAGIYVLIGKVVGQAGIYAPLSFLIASLVAALTACSYAELSARYPFSAGEAVYLQHGFNVPILSLLAGLLIMLAGAVSAAAIARGFVGYVQLLVNVPGDFIIFILIAVLSSVAIWGITESVRTAALFTFLEAIGLILIIAVTSPVMLELSEKNESLDFINEPFALQGVFVGAFLAFYAFIGFEDMVNIAEEVRDPEHVMPKAIFWALGVATILYFAVALLCVLTVTAEELATSDAPLALVYERATGREPFLISIIGIFAVINGALIQIIMASRLCYGLSRQGWLPEFLGQVNPVTRTPLVATVLVSFLILIMALWLPIETLAKITSFLLFIVFALVNLALWRIKHGEKYPAKTFSIPLWIPMTGFLVSSGFVITQLLLEAT